MGTSAGLDATKRAPVPGGGAFVPLGKSRRPLKVGIVTEYYYPLLGGISENVHYTALQLRAFGHDVRIITSRFQDGVVAGGDVPAPAADVIYMGRSVPFYGNGSRARFTIGAHLYRDVRDLLRRERFDVVQVHSPLFLALPPVAAVAAPRECPRVATFHSCFDSSRVYALFKGILQKQILDRIHLKTAVAPSVLASLHRYFDFDARIIPNGIDIDEFHPDAPRLEAFDRSKRTLLFLGRFDPRNGLSLMLAAFEIVKRRVPDVRLVVVGEGSLRNYYERQVSPAVRDDVHFVGPALGNRPRYYATCDIFCSPINKASFGITLLEAMATARPIVATENLGYKELLSPEEGILVPDHQPEAFADAIVRLLKDEDRCRSMGAAGRLKAMQYSWEVVTERLMSCFDELVAAS